MQSKAGLWPVVVVVVDPVQATPLSVGVGLFQHTPLQLQQVGYELITSPTYFFSSDLLLSNVSGFPSHLQTLREKLLDFMETEFYPNERVLQEHQNSPSRWKPHPLIDELKVCEAC